MLFGICLFFFQFQHVTCKSVAYRKKACIIFVICLFVSRNDCSNFYISRHLDEARLFLIAFANSVDRNFDTKFTIFTGILSAPNTFLVLRDFRIRFTSFGGTCLVEDTVSLELEQNFTGMLFLISIMLE